MISSKKMPELLSPAGEWSALHSAVRAGCDAVYFGVKGLNMRSSAGNFDILEIRKVMDFIHKNGKKGFLALNVIIYEHETEKARKILEESARCGVDAVILWDMAVLNMAKELGLEIHLSTQASISNFEAVKFYHSLGVRRIVLARECTLRDIKNIKARMSKEKIECELETFIHGAMCVSISGRCFLSQHTFGKSANRGECLQPCRREFMITDVDDESRYILQQDRVLSPRDLCTLPFIEELIEAGIDSFKIEGRMRPPEYVKTATSAYRRAIDAYAEGVLTEVLKEQLLAELAQSFNRGFEQGFFFGAPGELGADAQERDYEKVFLGEVLKYYNKINVAEVQLKHVGLSTGDEILVYGKTTPATFATVKEMEIKHSKVDSVEKGNKVGIKLEFTVRPKDKVFLWRRKRGDG